MIDSNFKTVRIFTRPGLNLTAPAACRGCIHLTERRFCQIWAFPETKWSKTACPDYTVSQTGPVSENH